MPSPCLCLCTSPCLFCLFCGMDVFLNLGFVPKVLPQVPKSHVRHVSLPPKVFILFQGKLCQVCLTLDIVTQHCPLQSLYLGTTQLSYKNIRKKIILIVCEFVLGHIHV